jgi:hypothetical protein
MKKATSGIYWSFLYEKKLPSKACSLGRKLWLKVLFADLLYEKNTAE